ncbi:protein YIPF5-like [Limulus polyphemus]|uniref:Protein YIPF n=1 Tax=Limulus polyphemus TaxID=6850 RepID=A0ABM1S698_LIMPO|nr:protein YIPF5-like [Limulus polyphemus]
MSGHRHREDAYAENYNWDNKFPSSPVSYTYGSEYEMGGSEFGTEPQFGSFDYSNPSPSIQPTVPGGMNMGGYIQPPNSNYINPAGGLYSGSILTPDPMPSPYIGSGDNFEDEPPLLEELGINFDHIMQKTLAVLNPIKEPEASILQETDLAGPLVFCMAFGVFLLLTGKVHFGYIYGIGVLGCLAMYALLNMMSMSGISVGCTVSVLGYCLLPMVMLSGVSIIFSLKGTLGTVIAILVVLWCALSASKLFATALVMDHQQPLVAYPCALLYGVFALLTVF